MILYRYKIWWNFILSITYLQQIIMFHINLDGSNLHTEIVYLEEIYNFLF
jgi:hypothetical protein